MINPNKLEATRKRWNNPRFAGGKFYLAVLSGGGYAKAARKVFARASDAEGYAERLRQRWIRLYAVAIVRMMEPSP